MENPNELGNSLRGISIAKNTIFNLLGYGIPVLFAIFLIPPLITGLGIERFGLLTLAWMVIGYFSFFDFGIGKSLTKIIAEKAYSDEAYKIPGIFWNSLLLILFISIIISLILYFLIPTLITYFFKLSDELLSEAINTFYILTLSIPIVTTNTAVRGFLEAYHKFGIINILRTFLGVFTFLGPLLVLYLTNSLFWIVVFLLFIRIVIWFLYLYKCFTVNENLKKEFKLKFEFEAIKPVLRLSIWITIVNIVGPIILYSDRFLISSIVSVASVTFYSTPYELVTKLLLLPSALVAVLFPAFSASYIHTPEVTKKLFLRGMKFVSIILFPVVLVIVTFAYEGMNLWLGREFAEKSTLILQFLAIGIFFSSISSIPSNFFQGVGKPKIPAILNLIELPFYLFGMYYSIFSFGIKGAAVFWLIAATIDCIINLILARIIFSINLEIKLITFLVIFIFAGLIPPFYIVELFFIKVIYTLILTILFIMVVWKYFLSDEEKGFIKTKIRLLLNR